ncbi:MAG: autotransporter strand-loop-strand O-heptosyltransferase [Schwartzia succinivorans]|nr:autotransporter strand-loop-strand O-heptosyltransferase [Schwartzia succinivorans]
MMEDRFPIRIFKCSNENYPQTLMSAWLEKFQEIAEPPETILGETEFEGLRIDFNCGLRMQIPNLGEDTLRVVIGNADSEEIYFDEDVSGVILVSFEKFFIPWQIEIFFQGTQIFSHTFNPMGMEVFFKFPSAAIGDAIALLPYVSDFIRRLKCKPIVSMAANLRDIAKRYYPDLVFADARSDKTYASYFVGTWMNFLAGASVDSRLMPMEIIGKTVLGTPYTLQTVRYIPTKSRAIQEPYVCIGVQASGTWKGWHHPRGWDEVVAYLKDAGYRVLCIDRERENVSEGISSKIPDGAEDFTGDIPLIERINLLAHADFFIGLSSGLSWLAYAVGCPVVMIAGFTLPWYEFDTPYRVQNFTKCHGCFNDVRAEWVHVQHCPYHRGTDRAFECSRSISPQQVIMTIERLRHDLSNENK